MRTGATALCRRAGEKCGALRLLDRGSRASLVSEGAFDYVVGGHRINWREWLSGAPERYEQWKNAALPGHDGIIEDNEEEGKQSEGEGIGSGAEGGGIVPESVLSGVGSRQQRQADGGYLTEAEKAEQRRLYAVEASGVRLRFECSMLVTREVVAEGDGGVDGAEEPAGQRPRWRPVRCWSSVAAAKCGVLLQRQASGEELSEAELHELLRTPGPANKTCKRSHRLVPVPPPPELKTRDTA